MPMDRSTYPKDWPAISRRVREEAGQKCQRCGVANGAFVVRAGDRCDVLDEWSAEIAAREGKKVTRIVLTVAHTGPNKHDKHDKHDLSSLEALCQRCHLREDLDDHVRHAAETRRRRRVEAGQMELPR